MTSIDDLYIVNYCHPNCTPLMNIMRLDPETAFVLACELAAKNAKTTAFYRFADFQNYYPLRLKADHMLHLWRQLCRVAKEWPPLKNLKGQ